MPIHDLGYRAQTQVEPRALSRWWAIASTGSRLAWRSGWLRRLVLFAWLPVVFFGAIFFAYETYDSAIVGGERPEGWAREFLFESGLLPPEIVDALERSERTARSSVWTYILFTFFRSSQSVLLVLVIGMIAPPLISQDIRTKAFILYFSRPITRLDYLLGKAATVLGYGLIVSTVPALFLYVFALLLSPTLAVFGDTWDLPLRVLGASALVLVPSTALSLMLSSLSGESRYASFGWFALWILGWAAYATAEAATAIHVAQRHGDFDFLSQAGETAPWHLLSLHHTLIRAQDWAFGLSPGFEGAAPAIGLLAVITVISVAILVRRISSPMRV